LAVAQVKAMDRSARHVRNFLDSMPKEYKISASWMAATRLASEQAKSPSLMGGLLIGCVDRPASLRPLSIRPEFPPEAGLVERGSAARGISAPTEIRLFRQENPESDRKARW